MKIHKHVSDVQPDSNFQMCLLYFIVTYCLTWYKWLSWWSCFSSSCLLYLSDWLQLRVLYESDSKYQLWLKQQQQGESFSINESKLLKKKLILLCCALALLCFNVPHILIAVLDFFFPVNRNLHPLQTWTMAVRVCSFALCEAQWVQSAWIHIRTVVVPGFPGGQKSWKHPQKWLKPLRLKHSLSSDI